MNAGEGIFPTFYLSGFECSTFDWKDVDYLKQFIPERGKIMPRRISGISAKDQRRIAMRYDRCTHTFFSVIDLLPVISYTVQ